MPINSVQMYIKGVLDGQWSPQLDPAQAFVAPPIPGDATVPQIYVWGGRLREARWTMPRSTPTVPGGFKKLEHEVFIWLDYPDDVNAPNRDTQFPTFIDAVLNTLRLSVLLPVPLTDPITGQLSSIIYLGEQLDVEYATPRQNGQIEWNQARVTCYVTEQLQG